MVTVRKATPKRTSAPMTAAESIFQSRGTKRKKEERRPEYAFWGNQEPGFGLIVAILLNGCRVETRSLFHVVAHR